MQFQSTLPVGGATRRPSGRRRRPRYFNPRSPWGERRLLLPMCIFPSYFNPRSPWGERQSAATYRFMAVLFQSTLPVGGATICGIFMPLAFADFNPRSPWGERRSRSRPTSDRKLFQSTLPVGGATDQFARVQARMAISIHAPRGGSDQVNKNFNLPIDISIHAPRGGSDVSFSADSPFSMQFQSTLPVGGATGNRLDTEVDSWISIHAPRGGSDIFHRL